MQAAFVTATELEPMDGPPGSEDYVTTAKHVCTVGAGGAGDSCKHQHSGATVDAGKPTRTPGWPTQARAGGQAGQDYA
jgi:hypothetical protein